MESRVKPASVLRRLPGKRMLGAGFAGLALSAAVVAGVSANAGPGGFGGITITAINGNSLSLQTADGWARTVDASGIKIVNGTATITLTDLKVGDDISLAETRNFDGTIAITEIDVVAPSVDGVVTAVGDTSLTVKQADGTSRTVTLTSSTTYRGPGGAMTLASITVGSDVSVQGTANADGSFTATYFY